MDDRADIHRDFQRVLAQSDNVADELVRSEQVLFGADVPAVVPDLSFNLASAFQGQDGLRAVENGLEHTQPFALAFIDVRMPPGWDGVVTAKAVMKADPDIHIVLCTAYEDYTWEGIREALGDSDRILMLKKPFDPAEVRQLAHTLTRKWVITRERQQLIENLGRSVAEKTEDLRRANEQLKVEMASRVRAETELRHAQKLEALGRLTAGIAHEINNPLSYVQSNVEYVSAELEELGTAIERERFDDLREAMSDAVSGVERIARIVEEISTFSRPTEQTLGPVSVPDALAGALKIVGKQIEHRARLVNQLGDPPLVVADLAPLEQVLVNVLVNAVQALPEANARGNELIVSGFAASETHFALEISDTACGISERDMERVFDPFFTTKAVGAGSGLGLSICQGIMRSFGGDITLRSELGVGTTVSIVLEIAVAG